ncbi:hypothetical protein BJ322DRAFT_1109326 [Thelephora terrestris]|uniref:Uncharacterized protein n=1 Tax=Thelephora terrestris TaxID=56493 RepID=A0A9P6HD09_9AGAM|nr:hypothetical protein BJ322DRAFT_1109326 [Thelephora terrestris]
MSSSSRNRRPYAFSPENGEYKSLYASSPDDEHSGQEGLADFTERQPRVAHRPDSVSTRSHPDSASTRSHPDPISARSRPSQPSDYCSSRPSDSRPSRPSDSRPSRPSDSRSGRPHVSFNHYKGHHDKAPASPDDNNTDSDTIKLLELRAVNEKLMRKIQDLEACEKTSLEYEQMFEALRDVVYDTKDDIQKIAGHIAVSSTGEIPGIGTFGIPLNPKEIHYKNLKYWPQSAWLAVRRKAKPKDCKAPVLSLFFEDESGKMVSDEVKEEVRGDLAAYWVDMLQEGHVPVHYSGLGLKRREDFRLTMEGKYPWLRLCEGHWKVRQLWVNHYKKTWIAAIIDNDPELKIKFANHPLAPIVVEIITDSEDSQPPRKRARASSKEKVLIVISSDTEIAAPASTPVPPTTTPIAPASTPAVTSTGSKCGRQDAGNIPGPEPPKKSKGKGVASDFHPAKAPPKKKITAKIGKADPFANVKIAQVIPAAPPVQNTPVASGSRIRLSSPPPPSPSQASDAEITDNSISPGPGALTQIRAALEGYDFPSSPTHSESSAAPVDPSPPVRAPITATTPPVISPIITTLTPSSGSNGNDSDSGTATPGSPKPPPAKRMKTGSQGRFPWRKLWCAEWMSAPGENRTKAAFDRYIRDTVTDEMKQAKIKELKSRPQNK